jgi:hypothetical protein
MGKTAEELLATEWWQTDDADFLTNVDEIESMVRQLQAHALLAINTAEQRGLVESTKYGSLRELLREKLRITRREAQRRVDRARAIDRLPVLAAALPGGEIGPEHVDIIVTTLDELPDGLPVTELDKSEHRMVDKAKILDAQLLRREGKILVYEYDQDGPEPVDEPLRRSSNDLDYSVSRSGKVQFRGVLDPEAGAAFTALLSPLAKPRPAEGQPDLRSAVERWGDAFAEVVILAANAGTAPVEGGQRPHLTITMSFDDLKTGIGSATLGDTGNLRAGDVRRIACDAKIIPAVLGKASEVLDIGRSTRTISAGIRRAVVLRDRGCAFPNCDRPSGWSDCHHVHHWADGGPTEVDNLVLLCRMHHTLTHKSPWQVRIRNGLPEFIPPKYLDPEQKPVHNTIHPPRTPLLA